jgi:hypothetical protein
MLVEGVYRFDAPATVLRTVPLPVAGEELGR